MSLDHELPKHYALLLGMGRPWEVKTVERKLQEKKVEIELGWPWGTAAKGPECGWECSIHDRAPERTWRHWDTMPFTTLIRARTPAGGVSGTRGQDEAGALGGAIGTVTLFFERWAVEGLLAGASVRQACEWLGLGWDAAQEIMRRAVARGWERRQRDQRPHLGLDEKSCQRGHSDLTLLTDWDPSRVLAVVEERTGEAADPWWATLTPEQKAAVDQVRRQEHQELLAEGDATLQGTRPLGWYHPQPFSPEQRDEFSGWKDQPLKGARAWAMKELFSPFWEYQAAAGARRFFKDWFGWVSRRPLQPMADVARRLQRPLENRLTYLRHHITNAVTEGLNSKIQSIKSAARGFRNFQNDRIRILFFCGKLNLYPL